MARCNSRTYQARQAQAKVLAATRELLAEEESMRRWPHPIPLPAAPQTAPSEEASQVWTQALEQLSCQNQLLVDLLGAVNSLTAALLCRQQS